MHTDTFTSDLSVDGRLLFTKAVLEHEPGAVGNVVLVV